MSGSSKNSFTTNTQERDINELFDEIVLTEERIASKGYNEGFAVGEEQGNQEGYQLGYAQGVQLGEELGGIYGFIVAQQQLPHTEKVQRALKQLRQLIDIFPRKNDPEADIIGALEDIRTLNKRLHAMLGTKQQQQLNKHDNTVQERKDYSF